HLTWLLALGIDGDKAKRLSRGERLRSELTIVGRPQAHDGVAGCQPRAVVVDSFAAALNDADGIRSPFHAHHVFQPDQAVVRRLQRVEIRGRQPPEAHHLEALPGGEQRAAAYAVSRERVDDTAVIHELGFVQARYPGGRFASELQRAGLLGRRFEY